MDRNNYFDENFDSSTFRNIILKRFKINDFFHCFEIIGNISSEINGYLRNALLKILDNFYEYKYIEKIMLERGINKGYFVESLHNNHVENFINLTPKNFEVKKLDVKNGDIEMKKLYFYRNIKNISGWKFIKSCLAISPFYIKFNLPQNFYQLLKKNEMEKSPQNCIMLRCTRCKKCDNNKPFKDCYPISMKMFINNIEFTNLLPREIYYSTHDKKERIPTPTILNNAILNTSDGVENDIPIKIKIQFDRSKNEKQEFAFAIFESTKVTSKDICNEILKKKKISLMTFNKHLTKFISSSDDICLESIKINLRSSITFEKIKIPFRGRYCLHINPDDLESYVKINERTESWLCKICENVCTPDDIMIDEFYVKILERHPEISEIELYSGMRYKLPGNNKIWSIDTFSIINNNEIKNGNIIEIKNIDRNVQSKKLKSFDNNKSINGSPIIECITIYDDSDGESQQKRKKYKSFFKKK